MDLDAYVAAHHLTWRRLQELAGRSSRSGAEADELVDLYQQTATHLSVVRSSAPDAAVVAYLSGLLGRARIRMVGSRALRWRDLGDFLGRRFPAALYRNRRWWLSTMALSYAVTAVMVWWLIEHPQVESRLLGKDAIDQLVNHDFADYYKQAAASEFAAKVWTNNAWVTALCISLGVFGLPVIYLLWNNIANLAIIASIMIRHDRASVFFGLILPHGLLELTAVFVAAGVGLKLFWTWISPGGRPRAQALAEEGRAAIGVAAGLVLVLLVSGLIEAFVTPSAMPTWARVGIGVAAEVVFLSYVFVLGRRAYRAGFTGDLDAALLEDRVAVAA